MRQAIPPWTVALHNWPLKPEGQPANVQIREPEARQHPNRDGCDNGRRGEGTTGVIQRKAIALAWLFHLVGDVHQPYTLHSYSLLTIPNATGGERNLCAGDAGRATRWTYTGFLGRGDYLKLESDTVAKRATALRNRQESQRVRLVELGKH